MSQPPVAGRQFGPGTETKREQQADIQELLGTLEDPDCRAIIEATSTEAHSASEISDKCDLPQSTAYRKLDRLAEVGILEERIRLCKSGQHITEYIRKVEEVSLSIDGESGISITVSEESVQQGNDSMVAGAD